MEVFGSMERAKEITVQQVKLGHFPSIYHRFPRDFILVTNAETPPHGASPFLK